MSKEEENLWSSLLQEVQESRSLGLPSSSGVLFLGDKESGKTTLVAKLQGNEDPKKGSGLEYTYIEVRDDCYESRANLSVSVLDGDISHANLLQYALSKENIFNNTVVLCASMETPWAIMDQLNKWAEVLQDHIESLTIEPEERAKFAAYQLERWRNYSDFVEFFDLVSPSHEASSRSFTAGGGGGKSSMSSSNTFDLGGVGDTTTAEAAAESDEILRNNLGIDVIVVITKTDAMSQLETEFNFNDEKFDFIQQAVRKFCLNLGASLFYLSVKDDKNCDLLYKYLVHRIYDFSFNTPALVMERDALFIPAGWDTPGKISLLHENIRTFLPSQPYQEVVRSPKFPRRLYQEARVEIVAEQEQDFLARLYQYLGDNEQQTEEGVLKTPERRVFGSPGVGGAKRAAAAVAGVTGPDYGGSRHHHLHHHGQTNLSSDGAISNFFHALLNKKTGGGSPAHLPMAAQTANSGGDAGEEEGQAEGQTHLPGEAVIHNQQQQQQHHVK